MFKDLNPEQREAVNCIDGPLLIMAGAGSGKTRVLTCRIANLIAQGILPENILAITFTNKAANEMKTRAEKLIGSPARDIILSTFHSFCAHLLRREIEITRKFNRNFAIYDAGDSKSLIKQCVQELNLSTEFFSNVNLKISDCKNNLIEPEACTEFILSKDFVYKSNVREIYRRYQKKLQENNALDFDDLIFVTVKIFKTHPDILEKYQERFQYISVDEYQDTNVAQYVLTNMLAAKYKNLCVVGDADQSIYGWRGADMRNILNFERDYPKAKVIKLEQNYRSTKTILQAANSVIKNNFDRKPKNLWTKNESGDKIKFIHCRDDKEEADIIAREIKRLVERENFLYNEIALLYRTNAQSRMFEERFMQAGIPYIIVGGLKFYDRKEIRDIVAYLHVIANPLNNVHLMRIINTPRRGLGATNMARLAAFAESSELAIFEVVANKKLLEQVDGLSPKFRDGIKKFAAMMMSFTESAQNLTLDKLIMSVLNESGYLKMLREDRENGKKENISREENLGEFIDSAKEFAELHPNGTLQDFLNHVALITDLDTVDEEESRVKLMTVHAAKGLEFSTVFVVGMEEKIFPHANSLETEAELEEERRACYVALTRAKKKLYITAAEKRMLFGNIKNQRISRFIEEIPASCIEGNLPASFVKKTPPPSKSTYKPPTAHRSAQMKPSQNKPANIVAWRVGDRLNHKKWGLGTVMEVSGIVITVTFANPEAGIKKLVSTIAPINKIS
ncbi:MAG: UvrD-helicase domain-containing protein [Selenomonadaceae bacterium]|nr:UvrD-helicase domain-containing protein [Selenomonadaceae bacterium]